MFRASVHIRYLCVALKRMLLNELKKTANGVFTSLDEVNSSEYGFDLEIDIETAIVCSELERERLEVLQKEINGLTKQQREVLYLKCYKKLDSDEIAEVMRLTSRTVYNTIYMAISRLRERLSKSFAGENRRGFSRIAVEKYVGFNLPVFFFLLSARQ